MHVIYRCNVLAFSDDNAYLTATRTHNEFFVWKLQSGELLERRDRDMSVDKDYTPPYYLKDVNGWQTVVEKSQRKRCKHGLCRPPGEYWVSQDQHTPIVGDRAALFCYGGGVLILDTSQVMHLYLDPAGWLDYDGSSSVPLWRRQSCGWTSRHAGDASVYGPGPTA